MTTFRAILSVCIFCLSIFLLYDLWYSGFNFWVMIVAIAGFGLAHLLWPRRKVNEAGPWLEVLEILVELPFRFIASLIRGLAGLFKGFDIGF